jgi:hypothetical protein
MPRALFRYRVLVRAIDDFVTAQDEPELTWAWEVARRCVAVYAECDPSKGTLDAATARAWEQFSACFTGGDEGYCGMHGLAEELYWRLPEGVSPSALDAVVRDARVAAGIAPPAPTTETAPVVALPTRPVLRLVRPDDG